MFDFLFNELSSVYNFVYYTCWDHYCYNYNNSNNNHIIIFMIIIPVTKNGIINDLDSQDLETDFRQLRGRGIA